MDQHEIIIAARNQAMITYPEADAKETLRASIDTAYRRAEVPLPSGPDYEDLINDVTDKVRRSYGYMTSQEFALVIEAGVSGEFGSRTKPSAAAIFGWLAAYMASDIRKEAIRNYRRNNSGDPAAGELTRAEKDELNRQAEVRALRSLWAECKANGRILETEHFRGYVAMACDGAMKRGLFAVLPEHWEAAREEAALNRHRLMRSALGLRGAAPDVPDSIVKWTMLEMCFSGQMQAGRDLVVNA